MGGAAALLRSRLALGAGLLLLLGPYYAFSERLPDLSTAGDIAWVGFVLTGLVLGLVLLALPLVRARGLFLFGLSLLVVGLGLDLSGAHVAATFPKLGGSALLGFWAIRWFERASWIVIIALLIPFVDTLSVWIGPTHQIVTNSPQTFDVASIAFPIPGERIIELRWRPPAGGERDAYDVLRRTALGLETLTDRPYCTVSGDQCDTSGVVFRVVTLSQKTRSFAVRAVSGARRGPISTITVPPSAGGSGSARAAPGPPGAVVDLRADSQPMLNELGLTDVFFFSLFLAAAARFGLRRSSAWAGMVAGLGLTMLISAYSDPFGIGGLPATPLICAGFLLPNADLLWRSVRRDGLGVG